jgi:hypothetical protein
MKKLNEKVILPAILASSENTVSVLRTDLLPVLRSLFAESKFPTFLLSKTRYTFDPKIVLDAVEDYVKADGSVDLTVGDLQTLDAFTKVKKEDDDHAMIPSVYALADFSESEKLVWPKTDILPGLSVVIGRRGSGKTTYLREEMKLDVLIRLNEPMEHVDAADEVYQATSVTNAVTVAVVLSVLGQTVAIDSFKSLVYGIEGAAMTGGMSSGVFDFMTTVNNIVANFGVHIMATVNPMDPNRVDAIFDMLAASVTGAVYIENYRVKSATYRLSTGRVIDEGRNWDDDFSDSRQTIGPNRPVDLPEEIEQTGTTPRVFRSDIDDEDSKPRVGGKVQF